MAGNEFADAALGYHHAQGEDVDDRISLGSTPYAAMLVRLTISFDPSDIPGRSNTTLDGQGQQWQRMRQSAADEAVG